MEQYMHVQIEETLGNGGTDYLRRCFKNTSDDYTDLSEYEKNV